MPTTTGKSKKASGENIARGNAAQFFVAGELCRRGYYAVVTLGNTPNTDILCSNKDGTKFVHIQVKTFIPGSKTCPVGKKAELFFGDNFIWVLAGIPKHGTGANFIYYIIPSADMAKNVEAIHKRYMKTPGKNGKMHNPSDFRTIHIPPNKCQYANGWNIEKYEGNWDVIKARLTD